MSKSQSYYSLISWLRQLGWVNISEPGFLHLWNGNNAYFIEFSWDFLSMADTATAYPCLLPLLPKRTPILFGAAMCLCKQAHLPHGSETISCQWLISWGFLGKLFSNAIRLCPFLLPACSCRSRAISGAAISQARKRMHQGRRQHAEDGKEERAKSWDGMASSLNSLTSHGLPAACL